MKKSLLLIALLVFLFVTPVRASVVTNFLPAPPNVPLWNNGNCATVFSAGAWTAPQGCYSASPATSKPTIITTSITPVSGATKTLLEITATIGGGGIHVWDQDGIDWQFSAGVDTDSPVLNSRDVNKVITSAVIQADCFSCGVPGRIVTVNITQH